ncbi:hypothetical protein MUP05_06505 [Candidatus Bathyarchaeota archaeon]|nr:hypothetical protein [Candidatus Bathyarchaeota archaeon]
MNLFSQDTKSGNSYPSDSEHSWASDIPDKTIGSDEHTESFSLRQEPNPTRKAWKITPQIKDSSVAKQLDELLSTISRYVSAAQEARGSLTHIPELHAYVLEDGSVILEWIFPDFRVGFNIEPNPADSGWQWVSGKRLDTGTASGRLDMGKVPSLLNDFVLPNI